MKKFFNILFILVTVLSFLILKEEVFALSAGKMLVSPVNVPTAQSSYGVYPNTVDMIANDIINSINKYSSFDVPDVNSAKGLIESYGMSKHYKEFLMNYRDNRVVDYKTCTMLSDKLGIDKILLVSGGFDVQNMFLNKPRSNKLTELFSSMLPLGRIFSKDLFFIGIPFMGSNIYDNAIEEEPIKPYYKLNVQLSLIDTGTGLSIWDKSYSQDIPASDFGNQINSFGENVISTEKLKNFSDNIAKDASSEVFMATKNSEYKTVRSTIVSSSDQAKTGTVKNKKTLSRDGKTTKDGQPSSTTNYLENKRKESYKNWVKENAKN